ncbi:MAG TPA: hypothetical protein VGO45_10310 [Bacteroidia bacterium]|jgi:hypothetical protein|nr:hypothetical protein [Bacteroidia bacterium]
MKKALLVLAVAGMFTAVSSSAVAAVTKSNVTCICGGDDKDKKCTKKCDGKCCKGKADKTENKADKPK